MNMRMQSLAIVISCAALANAAQSTMDATAEWKVVDGAAPELQKIADDQEYLRPVAIRRQEDVVKRLQDELRKAQQSKAKTRPEITSKQKRVQELRAKLTAEQAELQALRKGEQIALPHVNTVAKLDGRFAGSVDVENAVVFQVIDERNAIVDLNYTEYETEVIGNGTQNPVVVQNPVTRSLPVWLSGVSTAGMVDGRGVAIDLQLLIVRGTKTYRSADGGSKTLFEVTPFKLSDFVRVAK